MSIRTAFPPIGSCADAAVSGIQHVGHVVRDIDGAIALYRRMGFVVPPPSFPALAPHPGEPLRGLGRAIRTSISGAPSSNWSPWPTTANTVWWLPMPPSSPCRRPLRP